MYRLGLGLFVLAVIPVAAPAQVRLEWKLEPKQKFFVTIKTTNNQQIWLVQPELARQLGALMASATPSPVNCAPVCVRLRWLASPVIKATQKVEHATILYFEVLEKTDKGYVIQEKIVDVEMSRPDSKPSNPLAAKFKDVTLKLTMDPQFRVMKLEGYDDLIKSLTAKIPEKDSEKEIARIKALLSEDSLKRSAEQVFGSIPGKEVPNDFAWKEENTEMLPLIGEVSRRTTLKIGDVDSTGARVIDTRFTLNLHSKGTAAEGSADLLPFRIRGVELTSQSGRGEIRFDETKGRLVRKDNRITLKGEMTVRFSGAVNAADSLTFLHEEIATEMQVLDEMPKPK
jgi:hypothetical protein